MAPTSVMVSETETRKAIDPMTSKGELTTLDRLDLEEQADTALGIINDIPGQRGAGFRDWLRGNDIIEGEEREHQGSDGAMHKAAHDGKKFVQQELERKGITERDIPGFRK